MAKRSQKIERATELWKTMPNVSLEELQAAFAKKYKGESISNPAAYAAKRAAGITRKARKESQFGLDDPTMTQMKKVMELAVDKKGVGRLLEQLTTIKAIAEQVGGFDQLEISLTFLNQLMKD